MHRALSELKTINARIEKAINEFIPSGWVKKGKLVTGRVELEKFNRMVPADFQSITDLIDRKNRIKSAIVIKNGSTFVEIAGRDMTIADAINAKVNIDIRKKLVATIKAKHRAIMADIEKNNANVDAGAMKLAEVALGKENVKIDADAVKQVTKVYVEDNEFKLVDPIGIDDTVAALEKDITSFEAEVDAVLSEINAVTFIEF